MNKNKLLLIIPVLLVVTAVYVFAMYFKNKDKTLTNDDTTEFTVNDNNTVDSGKLKEIYLAGGCFWGLEAYMQKIKGVEDAVSGYANGKTDNPSYKDLHTSGHAETVKVVYNPDMVSLEELLEYYLRVVDPVSINKQGNDTGTQYRTGVYYTNNSEKTIIEKVLANEQNKYDKPIAIEVLPLQQFFIAEEYHHLLGDTYRNDLVEAIYAQATALTNASVSTDFTARSFRIDRAIDKVVTHKIWGFPIMFLLLAGVLWITIIGANYPSQWLSDLFVGWLYPLLKNGANVLHFPWWLSGFLIDGVYLATVWVISVMLPPMAIFFPLFTLLEDFGYLPRVAFNLDKLFRTAGAHGKQALTMSMGFGCNAAGVVATRIINSPREKLIAIITNNFSLCNGRWPTQILIATLFIGALVPKQWSDTVAMLAVIGIAVLGIVFSFFTSWLLSKTLLKGESSFFVLELPPYRPPRFFQTLYTSLIDRTLIVLWRAVVFAAPAGAVIWLICNLQIAHQPIALWLIQGLNPIGVFIGLNGVILLAYIHDIQRNP